MFLYDEHVLRKLFWASRKGGVILKRYEQQTPPTNFYCIIRIPKLVKIRSVVTEMEHKIESAQAICSVHEVSISYFTPEMEVNYELNFSV
jgi:hypothetical protein